jgi:predicted permease
MEIAAALFLIAVLGVFPVFALVVQVYRDSRGKKRNLAMRCYACESSGYLFPVPHYKGDTFLYCLPCVERQQKSQRVLGYLAMVIIAVALVGWVILSQG